ncbi:MAG: hypothetical protein ABJL54_05250 [Halioglobus sp.]
MKANFKPLGIVAAVAAASAGYTGVVNAQASGALAAETQLGDLAIVPYYTVNAGYATGINVINTSDRTQALKIRLRRAEDSMDALDFNVVLSPKDMYTGFVQASGDDIKFISNDNSCTAPAYPAGGFVMPSIYREGAETGYIEILSMGSPVQGTIADPIQGVIPVDNSAVAVAAKHSAEGVPADCKGVRDNFFKGGVVGATRGVVDSTTSVQIVKTTPTTNVWEASPNSLKVSYFIKSDETGVEFGDNAVHVENFLDGPAITNQQLGVFDGDLMGFDHPDLNGGSPIGGGASVGLYESLRTTLGAETLINDWSQNSTGDFSVDTDWVVTIPGQYLMVDFPFFQVDLDTAGAVPCTAAGTTITGPSGPVPLPACDFRDIPMTASFTVYDREEQGITVEEGDLVVSPQPPSEIPTDVLDKEVNVIQWGAAPVLNATEFIEVPKPEGAKFGFTELSATSAALKTQSICTYVLVGGNPVPNPIAAAFGYDIPAMTCASTDTPAPMVGFVAWQRNFADLPAANYGRIVEHSRTQASS